MNSIKDYIRYLKTAKIYYKLEDDKLRKLTPFSFIFKRNKVFEKGYAVNYYKIKRDVKYVHFYMTELEGKIKAYDSTNVSVSEKMTSLNLYDKIRISGGSSLLVTTYDRESSPLFQIEIAKPCDVRLSMDRCKIVGDETKLHGDIRGMKDIIVKGKLLEVEDADINVPHAEFKCEDTKFTDVRGNIYTLLFSKGKKIEFNGSEIFSDGGKFEECNPPKFDKSLWLVSSKILYNGIVYGDKTKGTVVDSTTNFNQDSVEMARARLSYSLSKLNEKVEEIEKKETKPLYKAIDERKEELAKWYAEQCITLEDGRVAVRTNFEKQKVKTLIKKED